MLLLLSRKRRWYITVFNLGVGFPYRGDELWWLWPWKRTDCKYISVSFECGFNSLKEYVKFDKEFEAALKESNAEAT